MDARSKPYFFSFDTKTKPGRVLAHCVRIETVELPINKAFNATEFTLFPADYDNDPRIRDLCNSAHRFMTTNGLI